jgi:PmbA protein
VTQVTAKNTDASLARIAELSSLAEDLLGRARERGADQCELSLSESHGLNVAVRLGDVETVEYTRDRSLSLTVYFGQRKANASTGDLSESGL